MLAPYLQRFVEFVASHPSCSVATVLATVAEASFASGLVDQWTHGVDINPLTSWDAFTLWAGLVLTPLGTSVSL